MEVEAIIAKARQQIDNAWKVQSPSNRILAVHKLMNWLFNCPELENALRYAQDASRLNHVHKTIISHKLRKHFLSYSDEFLKYFDPKMYDLDERTLITQLQRFVKSYGINTDSNNELTIGDIIQCLKFIQKLNPEANLIPLINYLEQQNYNQRTHYSIDETTAYTYFKQIARDDFLQNNSLGDPQLSSYSGEGTLLMSNVLLNFISEFYIHERVVKPSLNINLLDGLEVWNESFRYATTTHNLALGRYAKISFKPQNGRRGRRDDMSKTERLVHVIMTYGDKGTVKMKDCLRYTQLSKSQINDTVRALNIQLENMDYLIFLKRYKIENEEYIQLVITDLETEGFIKPSMFKLANITPTMKIIEG